MIAQKYNQLTNISTVGGREDDGKRSSTSLASATMNAVAVAEMSYDNRKD